METVIKEKCLNAGQTRTAGFLSVQMASNAETNERERSEKERESAAINRNSSTHCSYTSDLVWL